MTKKLTRLLAGLLVLMLAFSACGEMPSGSGGEKTGSENTSQPVSQTSVPKEDTPQGEPYTVRMIFSGFGIVPAELKMVEDAVSELTEERINARVELMPIESSALVQNLNLMFASDEKVDIFRSNIGNFVSQGAVQPLDSLIAEHGKDITAALDPDWLKCGIYDGQLYSIPTIRDMAQGVAVVFRKDILDKYGFQAEELKSFDDLEAMYETVLAGEPGMDMIGLSSASSPMINPVYDSLGDGFGVLTNQGQDDLKVVNWFETEEYMEYVRRMRRWNEKGIIASDEATNTENAVVRVKAGELLSWAGISKPGFEAQSENQTGYKISTWAHAEPLTSTTQINGVAWGMAANCVDPVSTMKLWNLLYCDEEVINLIDWGIEGRHYESVPGSDVLIRFPEGVDASNSGYNLNSGWQFGNQLISKIWETDSPDVYEKLQEYNEGALKSKALGFVWNASPVKNEVAAVTNVKEKYFTALECGSVDPETTVPQFISELKSAGIDTIVAEKQRQLDEWAKANGITG